MKKLDLDKYKIFLPEAGSHFSISIGQRDFGDKKHS